jgi:hypothetical protein
MIHIEQSVSTYWHFGLDKSWLCGAFQCILGCLAASLASTCLMALVLSSPTYDIQKRKPKAEPKQKFRHCCLSYVGQNCPVIYK